MASCCFKIPPCRIFCGLTDKIGCLDGSLRMPALACDMCLAIVVVILMMVAVAGVSSNDDTIKLTSWAYLENDAFNTYSNLWGVAVTKGDKWDSCDQWFTAPCPSECAGCYCWYRHDICKTISWDSLVDQVNDQETKAATVFSNVTKYVNIPTTDMADALSAASYAEDCRDSAQGNYRVVIILLITGVIKLIIRAVRSRFDKETDIGKKCTTLLSTILPLALNIGNVAGWHQNCIDALNDTPYDQFNFTAATCPSVILDAGGTCPGLASRDEFRKRLEDALVNQKGDWKPGPGYICLCISLAFMLVQFVIQLLVPAAPIPKPGEEAKAGDVQIEAGRA